MFWWQLFFSNLDIDITKNKDIERDGVNESARCEWKVWLFCYAWKMHFTFGSCCYCNQGGSDFYSYIHFVLVIMQEAPCYKSLMPTMSTLILRSHIHLWLEIVAVAKRTTSTFIYVQTFPQMGTAHRASTFYSKTKKCDLTVRIEIDQQVESCMQDISAKTLLSRWEWVMHFLVASLENWL